MLRNAHILISGGAGFIGTQLIARLIDANQITVLDTLHRDTLSRTDLSSHPNLTFVKGDVRDPAAVEHCMAHATHVVHLASLAGVDTVLRDPLATMEVILKGTFLMLEAAVRQGGIQRFIDLSTSEVFGSYAWKVSERDVTPMGPVGEARWTYAVSKLATEHLCHVMHRQNGLPAVTVRPFNIFGPGQLGEGAIHHFITQALRGESLTVHNEGDQIRAWCYIDDFIDGLLLTLSHPAAVGHAFNIGNPRTAITVHNLAELITQMVDPAIPVVHEPWPGVDVELRVPDISRAKHILGFSPKVDLKEGLARTIHWYRNQLGDGADGMPMSTATDNQLRSSPF